MNQTYYEILDLPKYGINEYTNLPVTYYEIIKAREKLIYGNNGEDSIDYSMRLKIDEAYRVLTDVDKRKEYDEKLKEEKSIEHSEPSIFKSSQNEEIKKEKDVKHYDEFYIDEEKIEEPQEENETIEELVEETTEESVDEAIQEVVEEISEIEQVSELKEENNTNTYEQEIVKPKVTFMHPKVERNFELVPQTSVAPFSELQTEETRIMEEYEEKLISQIYDLLNKPYSNYELSIALLKYQNQVELLKERIKFKENQKVTKSEYIEYCLSLLALKFRLKSAEKKLENIEEYISNYKKKKQIKNNKLLDEEKTKNHGLNKLYDKLDSTEEKLDNKEKYNMFYVKYLEIKKSKLLEKREKKINRMVLHRKGIVRGARIAIAYDITKTKVKDFIDNFKEEKNENARTF